MNVGIIGCGLIGKKRANALKAFSNDKLLVVCDINYERALNLANEYKCKVEQNWEKVTLNPDIDVIINSTSNDFLEKITLSALKNGKHVLCEKPLGRNSVEAKSMVDTAQFYGKILKVGFNHIFHPAIIKAKELLLNGEIGKIINIRAFYGHGSRPGMENEWRSKKIISGGGELLDQGVHLIDLIRWFAGDIKSVFGKIETKFWNIDVEDNAYAILNCDNDVTAIFHVSWTCWKNTFYFEIFGTDGYLKITGLGGSYGNESLELGKRNISGGRPSIQKYEYPDVDLSWESEWNEFRVSIEEKRQPLRNGWDGLVANQVVEAIYKSNELKTEIFIKNLGQN
ncbi:MAG: Gfo/Idh/MocA family oxidoreductase [Ignavibacterium sp.]|nr:Gfo/Idh/MocA family oxidoreductase [Ignavibacterium sp.]MDW8376173.1 Gfo/Idh/MocA family oxidoreductase [Ignavibacteriales bacterium]